MSTYLALPNYTNNLRRLGWADEDLAGEGSGALVDAIVAWGDVDAVVERVRAHQAAGADHVCLQVLLPDFTAVPMAEWEALAEALQPGAACTWSNREPGVIDLAGRGGAPVFLTLGSRPGAAWRPGGEPTEATRQTHERARAPATDGFRADEGAG